MKVERIIETCLYVTDLDQAYDFYQKILGLESFSRFVFSLWESSFTSFQSFRNKKRRLWGSIARYVRRRSCGFFHAWDRSRKLAKTPSGIQHSHWTRNQLEQRRKIHLLSCPFRQQSRTDHPTNLGFARTVHKRTKKLTIETTTKG